MPVYCPIRVRDCVWYAYTRATVISLLFISTVRHEKKPLTTRQAAQSYLWQQRRQPAARRASSVKGHALKLERVRQRKELLQRSCGLLTITEGHR